MMAAAKAGERRNFALYKESRKIIDFTYGNANYIQSQK